MQKNILVRSIAALSGIVMLASVAACGDQHCRHDRQQLLLRFHFQVHPDLRQLLGRRRLLSAGRRVSFLNDRL